MLPKSYPEERCWFVEGTVDSIENDKCNGNLITTSSVNLGEDVQSQSPLQNLSALPRSLSSTG